KDMSWTGLLEFADDTITDYSRSSPSIESNSNELQNNSSSVSENRESTSSILSKPEIKFAKAADSPTGNSQNNIDDKDLTCLVAKASADESMLWHRRLGKQHKASCKTKLVNSVSKPLHTLHMDLFGPTSDETSGILRDFITEIDNLKKLKNGVAKRRNRTLIEAARTMLADGKLPVTFWAEAVNTACYVQNRVLVNKSQNKTPYELFNGRTPAIGFLKPFGCHVTILNTLDNLGKFEAKGDEESSTSNAQDACNADAPESSGNSNPAATLTNPPADQMETLTVETLSHTVSSPVPTACLDDSPQSLSDTRLISKRVTSQDDTPSLDNIQTLSNRFEDILGVTTNTGDSHRVEADLGNMKNNMSASPTPTFKIHKDHTKSQIIGPVDTPVQTRTKSKEMEEHSFIALIHHMTNSDLLQFCLFSCFLSQEEPKKISVALKDPSWVEAIQEELL
nr:hypothetical protein [Tanacetum cinerariifolium]